MMTGQRGGRLSLKRVLVAVIILFVLAAGCSAPKLRELPTYTNPVYAGTQDKLPEAADPATLKYNGEYYTYVTGDPCLVLKSEDLVHWQLAGPMMSGKANCWAPSVVYKNGTFYAYAATVEPGVAEGERRVQLFTSQSPLGPFEKKATLTEHYSYDAEYFMDDDGREYLYWTQLCGTLPFRCGGNATVVDRLVGMDGLAGEVSLVAEPEGWECRNRCILEAPAVLKRDGRYFVQYSGAAYENDSYGGGYVVADKPAQTAWTRQEQVLKSVDPNVNGPGGADWVKGPNNLDDWTIYHGRGITRETWDRWIRIDPVMWGRDRFWLPGAPTFEPQLAPAMPAFRDLFSAKELNKAWKTRLGVWRAEGGVLRQTTPAGTAMARLTGFDAVDFVAEANVRLLDGPPGGAAGLIFFQVNDKGYAAAVLDRAQHALVVTASSGAVGAKFALPSDFDMKAFHQILVVRSGDRITLAVDGRTLGVWGAPFGQPGGIGLITVEAAAEFDGVTFTQGWEDFFDSKGLRWDNPEDGSGSQGEWAVANGVLSGSGDGARAFRGSRQWESYEFTASVNPNGRAGIYAAYYDQKNFATVTVDSQTRKLTLKATVAGKAEPEAEAALQTAQWHTLRVTKNGNVFTIQADGKQVLKQTINLPKGQPGLLVESGQAGFDSIRAVRWH